MWGRGVTQVPVSHPALTLHVPPEGVCGCVHTHSHSHAYTRTSRQPSEGKAWVKVGLAGPSMLEVPRQPGETAFTALANLSVQGLVLSLIGLDTEFLSVPEKEDAERTIRGNIRSSLVSEPVASGLICSES